MVDADFTAHTLSGSFNLAGPQDGGGPVRDFGAFAFSATAGGGGAFGMPNVTQAGQTVGQLEPVFFGPDASEFGGTFILNRGDGVTLGGPPQPTDYWNFGSILAVKLFYLPRQSV